MAPSHSCVLAQSQYAGSQRFYTNRCAVNSASSKSQRRVQAYAVSAGADGFYAAGTSFQQLGLSASIADSIQQAGFSDPAQIQAQAIPAVLSGADVAIASETGSGKTLAYLLPIINSLKQRQKDQQENRRDAASWFHHCALVLCPNMELCEQVAKAAESLVTSSSGTPQPLCVARTVSVRNPPQMRIPTDIVVSTPAALSNFLDEAGSSYGPQWEMNNFAQCVRHVVADEADALFTSDSFFKPLNRILDNMRASDRAFTARAVSSTTGISVDDFQDLKRGFKMAAFQGGVPAMLEAGWHPPEGSVSTGDDGNVLGLEEKVPSDLWVGEPHRCRSYIFVGATFPRAGGKSVAGDLTKRFPSMQWLEGPQLHASKRGVHHEWVRVSEADRSETIAAVVTALRGQRNTSGSIGRLGHALVFCRDTASARMMHEELQMVGIDAALYHKKMPLPARQESLKRLQQQEGGVLVCTDAAARGLDFPSITHVIQADFADNAVDFLHRIGRTGRAFRGGTVTSCYTEEREDLALAIKQAIMDGTPVEGTFSRNRSFSMKMKKHGRFIPRGSTA